MRLLDQQKLFAHNVGRLIMHAYELGYSISLGEAWRPDEQCEINALGWRGRADLARLIAPMFPQLAACLNNNGKADGIRTSLHGDRLALDINLFQGQKLLSRSEEYEVLGVYWESLHPENCWGGRFIDARGRPKPDGNHFSMTWQGRK
jgi:hypothetical protein